MGKIYIFKNDEYIRHSYGQGSDSSSPKKITEYWSGWPASWATTTFFIHAAMFYPGNLKFYLFHLDEYVRHSYGRGPDHGYPKKITEYWSGWPDSWGTDGIYAAFFYPCNNKFYIFSQDEYVRHSYGQGPDPGYPKKVSEVWSGWPSSWGTSRMDHIHAALYYPC